MPRALTTSTATLIAVLSLALAAAPSLGRRSGTIDGAQTLHVRSGPGVEHPSIGLLHRGNTVEVVSIDGNWALVRHAGREGWVHASFVTVQDPPVHTQAIAPTPTRTPGPVDDIVAMPDVQVAPAFEGVAPAAATPPELGADLRANVDRILTLTEAMHHDLERRRNTLPSGTTTRADDGIGLQGGIGLIALGAVIGFFIGTVVGRQQERRGRSRVRF